VDQGLGRDFPRRGPYPVVAMTLLSLEGVTKRFPAGLDEIPVLENVSFHVEEGDFIGVQGERRSGKSILLRIAAGWERPDEGKVLFAGQDLWALSDGARAKLRRKDGIVLASGTWRPPSNKPALRHLQETLACNRVSLREASEPAHRALERVGLSQSAYTPSDRLSPGELIRLGLALRLIHRPRLLLIDEPAMLLRPSEAVQLYELLGKLGRDANLALLIASEELAPIRIARRRFSLDDGALRSMDKPSGELLEFPDPRAATRRR
jgi:predicted ABC-type transport system involved in lysophospholipase L1 biosynthesis ATPase subunit